MTDQQIEAEQRYYLALSIAKSMYHKGVISAEVLSIIDTNLLETFKPVSATLLSGKPLT